MAGFASVVSSSRRLNRTAKAASAPKTIAVPNKVEVVTPNEPVPAASPVVPEVAPDTQAQIEDVLRRNRGRASTVTSSFRGVELSEEELTALTPRRKTLLGE